jgi:transcriptional regulator with XRE-family HTH domain
MMDLNEILGIDTSNPIARRAADAAEADRELLQALVRRRNELGLSQTDVAKRMDISQGALSRIESGLRDPHLSTLRRYAVAVEAVVHHTIVPDRSASAVRAERILTVVRDLEVEDDDWQDTAAEDEFATGVNWHDAAYV